MAGSFAAFFLSVTAMLRKPVPLFILGCALAPLFYVFNFVNVSDYRHYGFILVSVIFALWIAAAYPASQGSKWPAWTRRAGRAL